MIRDYIKSQKALIILIPILSLISYGYLAFSGSVGIDTEYLIANPGTTMGWEHIGRFGGVFIAKLFHLNYYNPLYLGTFFLVFYILSVEFLVFFTYFFAKGNKELPYWMLAILVPTSPIYMFQFYFTMMIGMVGFGFFIITIGAFVSVLLIFRDFKLYTLPILLINLVPIVLGLGIYQAFVPFFISLCALFSLIRIHYSYNEGEGLKALKRLVILGVYFILAYIIYTKLANADATSDYLTQKVMWQSEGILACVKNVALGVAKEVLGFRASRFSIYLLDVIMIIALFIRWIKNKTKINDIKWVENIVIIATMLTPFMLTVYLGVEVDVRALYNLPVIAAGMAMFLYPRFKIKPIKELALICLAVQIIMCAQLSYTDHVRFKSDWENSMALLSLINESGVDYKKPIIYIGKKEANLNNLCNRIDVFGESMWEHDYEDTEFGGVTKRIQGFLKAISIYTEFVFPFPEDFYKNEESFKRELGIFPDSSCIKEMNDYIVVKLSE